MTTQPVLGLGARRNHGDTPNTGTAPAPIVPVLTGEVATAVTGVADAEADKAAVAAEEAATVAAEKAATGTDTGRSLRNVPAETASPTVPTAPRVPQI